MHKFCFKGDIDEFDSDTEERDISMESTLDKVSLLKVALCVFVDLFYFLQSLIPCRIVLWFPLSRLTH